MNREFPLISKLKCSNSTQSYAKIYVANMLSKSKP